MTANHARGEVDLTLTLNGTAHEVVLKPEHGRGPALDAALPGGVLGTLLRISGDRDIRSRELALVIFHLGDQKLGTVSELERAVFETGVVSVAGAVTAALAALSGGSQSSGEEDAPSSLATG